MDSTRLFALTACVLASHAQAQILNEDHKLLADDGALGDIFGKSVAVDGGVAIVGAYLDDDNGTDSGSAYLFNTTTGQQMHKLVPSDGMASDSAAFAVAVAGDYALVGANLDDDVTAGVDAGSVYVFSVSTGQQLHRLQPNDIEEGDNFGRSVAISGNIAIINSYFDDDNGTSSGSAYLFDLSTGQQIAKLLPVDGSSFEAFGSVAISGNLAVVGAPLDIHEGVVTGSAYVFDTLTGQQLHRLLASDGASNDHFGNAVAISGNLALIGADRNDDAGTDSGSAYIFDATTGQQLRKLIPADGSASDNFGCAVALSGSAAVVGAYLDDDNGTDSGSAYLFNAATGDQIAKLLPSDGESSEEFGYAVACSGTVAVISAPDDDDNSLFSGSAYVFEVSVPANCPADTNGDGMLSPADFSAWVSAFNANAPACDQNDDGMCSPADFSAWVANYNAGC